MSIRTRIQHSTSGRDLRVPATPRRCHQQLYDIYIFLQSCAVASRVNENDRKVLFITHFVNFVVSPLLSSSPKCRYFGAYQAHPVLQVLLYYTPPNLITSLIILASVSNIQHVIIPLTRTPYVTFRTCKPLTEIVLTRFTVLMSVIYTREWMSSLFKK